VKRPIGVTILAVFLLFNGVMLAVHAAVLYSHPNIGTGFTSAYLKHLFPIDRIDATAILYGAMVGAVVSLVTGGGLWFLKDLARWAVLLVTGIPLGRGLIGAVVTLTNDPSQFRTDFPDAFWFRTIVFGVIVFYLTRSDVLRAFGRYDRFTAEIDPKKHDLLDISGS
jgi:hypothetical protein